MEANNVQPQLTIINGSELSSSDISQFNQIARKAFKKDFDFITPESSTPEDVIFFLKQNEEILAIGRLRLITGIKIGETPYTKPVWGRADIAAVYKGKGYGSQIVNSMSSYAKAHNMSPIGFHEKCSLAEFYKKCGLEIDEEIGSKIQAPNRKTGELENYAGANVSHFPNDPLLKAIRESEFITTLPYGW